MSNKPVIMVIMDPGLRRTPALLRAMSLAKIMDTSLKLYVFEFHKGLASAVRINTNLYLGRTFDKAPLSMTDRQVLAAKLRSVHCKCCWSNICLNG